MNQPVQNKKLTVIAMTAILSLNIFIFSPWSLYLTNIEQFTTSLLEVMKLCLIPALILCLLFVPVFALLPAKNMHRVAALLAMFSILIWFQGNVLLWDYGILDGRNIVWSKHVWRGWIDGILWTTAIVSVYTFYKKIGMLVIKSAVFILILQSITICYMTYENWKLIDDEINNKYEENLPELFKFSKKGNVLHIVSDGFQADVFNELLHHEKLKDRYQQSFQGFVFYRETLGIFPHTVFAIPAFLAGEIYSNKSPKDIYIDNVLNGKTILSVANNEGYEIDIASGDNYSTKRYSNLPFKYMYNLQHIGSTSVKFKDTAIIMDLALVRVSPHFLNQFIYNDQQWLISQYVVTEPNFLFDYFTHTYFLNLFSQYMSIEREKPVYKYLHVMNTHNPMVVDAQCKYSNNPGGMERKSFTIQSKCTLDTLSILFDKMKDLGVYDSTLMIVHGDHGGWVPNYRQGPPVMIATGVEAPKWLTSLASPLLAIKKPYDKTNFRVSDMHASLLDIPDTISDIMDWDANFKHRSLEKTNPNEPRKRFFRYYDGQIFDYEADYTEPIHEYSIEGSHYEVEWKLENVFYPPE